MRLPAVLRFRGLAGRLTTLFLPLIIGMAALYLAFFYFQTSRALRREFESKIEAISTSLASNCVQSLRSGNYSPVEALMLGLSKQDDLLLAAVYDKSGTPINTYLKPGAEADTALPQGILSAMAKGEPRLIRDDRAYGMFMPVKVAAKGGLPGTGEEEVAGFIRLSFATAQLVSDLNRIIRIGIVFGLLTVALSAVLTLIFARNIARPIQTIAATMSEIGSGEGDFTRQLAVTGRDEISQLASGFNSFSRAMSGIVKEMTGATDELDQEAQNLASMAQQLTAATQEISSTVQGVSAASSAQMEAVRQTSQEAQSAQRIATATMQHAGSAKQSADRIMQLSSSGLSDADAAAVQVEMIMTAFISLQSRIGNFSGESQKISEIIRAIDDIAQKTQLLALNAAIEAAHAGQTGRGFGVIADEIKLLAETSRIRNEEISGIIKKLEAGTLEITAQSKEVASQVAASREVLVNSSSRLRQIIEEIGKSAVVLEEIVDQGSVSQNAINLLVGALDRVAHEAENNASGAQEVSAGMEQQSASFANLSESTQTLARLSSGIKELVKRFRTA